MGIFGFCGVVGYMMGIFGFWGIVGVMMAIFGFLGIVGYMMGIFGFWGIVGYMMGIFGFWEIVWVTCLIDLFVVCLIPEPLISNLQVDVFQITFTVSVLANLERSKNCIKCFCAKTKGNENIT